MAVRARDSRQQAASYSKSWQQVASHRVRASILPGLPRGEQAFRRCHFYVGTRAGRCT